MWTATESELAGNVTTSTLIRDTAISSPKLQIHEVTHYKQGNSSTTLHHTSAVHCTDAWWLSGRALDLRFTGRGFNSRPVAFT